MHMPGKDEIPTPILGSKRLNKPGKPRGGAADDTVVGNTEDEQITVHRLMGTGE